MFAQTQNIKRNVQRAFSFALSLPTIRQSNLAALAWLEETLWKDVMETIEATFKVVTPMFMSGADQSQAELRLPSIKGALRFWWRALAWQRLGNVQAIHAEENYLFGSADQDVGQAAVLMKLSAHKADVLAVDKVLEDGRQPVGDGARYLGYGVMEAFASRKKGTQAGQLTRPCLQAPFTFRVVLVCKRSVSDDQKKQLKEALELLGLIGGVGSKSRKGYGSVTLVDLKPNDGSWQPRATIEQLQEVLAVFQSRVQDIGQPPYTALSQDSRFVLVEGNRGESALSLLSRLGREQVFFRSWGKDGKVLGKKREENFKEDHDLMRTRARSIKYPKRIAFGLPHNYGKPQHLHVTATEHDRRASPLFIHIHQADQYSPIAVVSFLPADFLPDNESISLLGRNEPFQQDENFWQPIKDFLVRLEGRHYDKPLKRHETFAKVVTV